MVSDKRAQVSTHAAVMRHRSGRLALWDGMGLFIGPALETTIHAHHALQVAIGLERPLRVGRSCAPPLLAPAVIIVADVPHFVDGSGDLAAMIYLDPESARAGTLRRTWRDREVVDLYGDVAHQAARLFLDAWHRREPKEKLATVCRTVLDLVGVTEERTADLDPRIRRVLARLSGSGGVQIAAATLAAEVALSPGRLGHLFREQVGLPIRRYVLWRRMEAALSAAERGASLTDAAHEAGFADSAHLSRTFRKMFGLPPSAVAPDRATLKDE